MREHTGLPLYLHGTEIQGWQYQVPRSHCRLKGKLECSCKQHCGQGKFKSRLCEAWHSYTTSEQVKSTACQQLVRPVLEYATAAWDSASYTATSRLEAKQRRDARLICGIRRTDQTSSTSGLLQRLNWQPPLERRSQRRLAIFSQYHHTNTVQPLAAKHVFSRKHPDQYFITHSNTLHHQRSFFIRTACEWNEIPTSSWLSRLRNI